MAVNKKPLYQPWNEEEFNGDIRVSRGMNWLQRHLYRALLQATFFCSTRPYLPNDDAQLWLLADTESREMWDANKAPVLAMFHAVEVEGEKLLENKRVKEDWEKLVASRDRMAELGARGAAAKRTDTDEVSDGSADAERTPSVRLLLGQRTPRIETVREKGEREGEVSEEKVTGQGSNAAPPKKLLGEWENLRRVYHRKFNKNPADPKRHKNTYADACGKYGEEIVLNCFDSWADSKRDWIRSGDIQQPLFVFWKALPDMAADAQNEQHEAAEAEQRATQARQQDERNAAAVEQSIARQKAEDVAFMEKAPPPENGGSPFDYIPPDDDDHSPLAEAWRAAQPAKGAE